MDSLNGKLILVIGASSGIGAQTAVTLSERGAKVVLAARREDKLQEVMARLAPGEHAYYRLDVSDVDSIAGVIDGIVKEHGKLDGMVYAAGIGWDIPLRNLRYENLLKHFQTNYFGFVESVRQVCNRGRYGEDFRIVAVSSVSSLLGEKAHTAYAATKAAMDASIRCIAKELAPKGICINSVAPSMVNTKMYKDFLDQNGEHGDANQRTLARQYLGIGEPSDVANAICFLLSPEARFITGITMPVDGGFTSSC